MKLSPHFTLEEMTATNYPSLQSKPSIESVVNLVYLCAVVLEPLRESMHRPLKINSGYRGRELNKAVGGVWNSFHMKGRAADVHCANMSEARLMLSILAENKEVDLALIEQKTSIWVHVQTAENPRNKIIY